MKGPWLTRIAGLLVGLLLVVSLAYLQILYNEKALFSCLSAFSVVSIAALISVPTSPSRLPASSFCCVTSLVFVGYIALRALTSPSAYHARYDLYLVIAALVIYGVTLCAVTNARYRIALIVALLAFAVVVHVLVSVVQSGFGQNYSTWVNALENVAHNPRGTGLYANPDHLAGSLEVLGILGLSVTCWSRWPRWTKVLLGYLTAICYFGLALTGSRGGYLSGLASLTLFAILSLIVLWRGGTRYVLRAGGSGLVLILAGVFAAWLFLSHSPPHQNALERIVTDEGRLQLWQAAIEQWKLKPIVGTGSETYRFYGREFRNEKMQQDPGDVHNDYLQLLCEYGILGAAAFLAFFWAHTRNAWRSFVRLGPDRLAGGYSPLSDRLALTIGALCAIGAYVVHSAVDFNLHIPANALLLAFVFGLTANPGTSEVSPHPTSNFLIIPRVAVAALALILLLQCVRLLPGEYFSEESRAALSDDDPQTALSFANKGLAYEQQNPELFFLQGCSMRALTSQEGDPSERSTLFAGAVSAFEKARALVPLDGTYPIELGITYDRQGRFAEAERLYQIAITRDPRSETLQNLYQTHRNAWEKTRQPSPD